MFFFFNLAGIVFSTVLYVVKCVFSFVRYFVSKGAAVDQKGGILNTTPLHWAVR